MNKKEDLRVYLNMFVGRGAELSEYIDLLRVFKNIGGEQSEAVEILNELRAKYTEEESIEDRILEILDVVVGWCIPSNRIW